MTEPVKWERGMYAIVNTKCMSEPIWGSVVKIINVFSGYLKFEYVIPAIESNREIGRCGSLEDFKLTPVSVSANRDATFLLRRD